MRCPLTQADLTSPEVFAVKFCVSKPDQGRTKICFFQTIAGKLVCVANLLVPDGLARELGKVLSGGVKKSEEGYIR